ncbi:hypothetical protein B0T24DRAFT_684160 [Lasiosphaeria ovina]|uniref:2EXR domain-containing protein n=1 Tax=Lasiosphaeria ovina TaxID=92902 RepID=A0AAE0JUS9_9PEZI|nr:hypothetical protein B0T24DRAFT_684160 [Lasiosphaeria ovina]
MPSSCRSTSTDFPQFALLPAEIQLMIWAEAAAQSPHVHFFQNLEPKFEKWIDEDVLLVPNGQSGARGLVHLSRACKDAHSAVARREQAIDTKTLLRIMLGEARTGTTLRLTLDLRADLVCLGGPDASRQELDAMLEWADPSHIIFTGARHLAVRYHPEWDRFRVKPVDHGDTCHRTLWRRRDGMPFCGVCIRCLMARFKKLESFYLIVDGCSPSESATPNNVEAQRAFECPGLKPRAREFQAYNRTYFELLDPWQRDELRLPVTSLKEVENSISYKFCASLV